MKSSILAQTFHKICSILPIFFLSGCIGYTPTYYDDNVEFIIHGFGGAAYADDEEIKVYIDGKEVEVKKSKTSRSSYTWHDYSAETRYGGREILYCSPKEYRISGNEFFYDISFKVKRERKNKTIKITRTGKPDKIINLYYQATDEKWASGKSEWFLKRETTAAILLLPTNSYEVISLFGDSIVEIFRGNFRDGGGVAVTSLVWLPAAVVIDIYNIVIGLPSTAIINPWTNYKMHQQNGETCFWVHKR